MIMAMVSTGRRPKVAIAHDYLTQRGGAERVILAMLRAFPGATVHTTLYDPAGTYPEFRDARVVTSPLNRIPPLRQDHRLALPFLPGAINRLPVDADVVIASSSGWAHGVPTSGRKLVYCHAPAKWLYQPAAYLGHEPSASIKGRALQTMTPWLRRWDRLAAASADRYLANSTVVRDRVKAAYGIDAAIAFPPFGVGDDGPQREVREVADWRDGYHLIVSRLLPYKNVTEAIAAFRGLPGQRLVVVGQGPLEGELLAGFPSNVRLVNGLDDAGLRWVYAHASALIAPSIEDFGLTPLEAGAFGKPTLALRGGGYLDTVVEDVTGMFFDAPTPDAIRSAVLAASLRRWDGEAITKHVDQFSEPRFHERLTAEVESLLAQSH